MAQQTTQLLYACLLSEASPQRELLNLMQFLAEPSFLIEELCHTQHIPGMALNEAIPKWAPYSAKRERQLKPSTANTSKAPSQVPKLHKAYAIVSYCIDYKAIARFAVPVAGYRDTVSDIRGTCCLSGDVSKP